MYNNGEEYTKKNHGSDRKIEPEILPVDPDVTRQPTDPF